MEEGASPTNLIVNYLPQSLTDDEFSALFTPLGPVVDLHIARDKSTGYSYGYGFVKYAFPEDAQRALARMNGTPVQHKVIKVSYSRPATANTKDTNLYISHLGPAIDEDSLAALFEPLGQIITLSVLRAPNGQAKGTGFVRYASQAEAQRAMNTLHGTRTLEGAQQPLSVRLAEDHGKRKSAFFAQRQLKGDEGRPELPRLYLCHLGVGVAEGRVAELCSPFGPIRHMNVVSGRGIAFVDYGTHAEAERAIGQLHDSTTMSGESHPIKVRYAKAAKAAGSGPPGPYAPRAGYPGPPVGYAGAVGGPPAWVGGPGYGPPPGLPAWGPGPQHYGAGYYGGGGPPPYGAPWGGGPPAAEYGHPSEAGPGGAWGAPPVNGGYRGGWKAGHARGHQRYDPMSARGRGRGRSRGGYY